jgi:ribosomal-protein-alanine N-acetyltransferase
MIQTQRLSIRPLQKEDEQLLFPLHTDPEVMAKVRPPDRDIEQTRQRVNEILEYMQQHPGHGLYLAFENDRFIGWAVLTHVEDNPDNPIEIGYRLHRREWGKGYATEMAVAVRDFARSIGIESLCGITAQNNPASMRVLEKIGMKYQGLRQYYGGNYCFYEMNLTA